MTYNSLPSPTPLFFPARGQILVKSLAFEQNGFFRLDTAIACLLELVYTTVRPRSSFRVDQM